MLLQLAVGVIVAYGGIVGVMSSKRSLTYVPDLARVLPAVAGLPQAEEIMRSQPADSERLVAWHVLAP